MTGHTVKMMHITKRTAASTTMDSPTSGDMFYIDSTSPTRSDSYCASRCSNVGTAWLLDTWPSSAYLSPVSMDLRSAHRGQLDIPRVTVNIRRTCVLSCWTICLERSSCLSALSLSNFRNQLKHFYFSSY